MKGVRRIRDGFARVNGSGEACLIPYFVAGYPKLRDTREFLWKASEAGANLIELGIPFSDPVADGPVIARATHEALAAGATPKKCLALVAEMRREGFDLPLLGMTYANVLYAPGLASTARRWARAGLDGAIVPDISLEDSSEYRAAFRNESLATAFFAAPSTRPQRLRAAFRASTGFLYLVAVYGTTGARTTLSAETLDLLRNAKQGRIPEDPPICVGFGISTAHHVRTLRRAGADGVIVGSAVVEAIDAGGDLRKYLKTLKVAALPGE